MQIAIIPSSNLHGWNLFLILYRLTCILLKLNNYCPFSCRVKWQVAIEVVGVDPEYVGTFADPL